MAIIKSARTAQAIKTPGRHRAGDGLYLVLSLKGHKTWVLRYQLEGKRTDMGLGSLGDVSLADARSAAAAARRQIAQKVDPIRAREAAIKASLPVPTFSEIANRVIEGVGTQSTNEKVRYRAKLLLGKKYCARILHRPVNAITVADIARLLISVRQTKAETARKLHGLLAKVFETARVLLRDQHGLAFEDPTNLKDLKALGYIRGVRNRPHPALHWQEAPKFIATLRQQQGIAARALEVALLTGLREAEVAGAQWSEFDFDAAVWTVPIERMKDRLHRKTPHRVPLSKSMLKVLRGLKDSNPRWVFPGVDPARPIAPQSLLERLKKLNIDERGRPLWVDADGQRPIVVHGFRSTLRTWAEEHGFRREAAEQSLAHKIGSQVEILYRRTDILDERRRLMDEWADFLNAPREAKVVSIRRPKR
jgi:integrase